MDDQPDVTGEADAGLAWLDNQPDAADWALDTRDATPVRRLGSEELTAVLCGIAAPRPLAVLAAKPGLQRRIRSATGCYLDLGDWTVPVDGGSHLLHFLSDQQWVRHWLVVVDGSDSGLVLSSTSPIGFDLPVEDTPLPSVIPVDGSVDLSVTEDSMARFLYRFWIENEIALRSFSQEPLVGRLADYARYAADDR